MKRFWVKFTPLIVLVLTFWLTFQPVLAATIDDLRKQSDLYSSMAASARQQREQREKDAAEVQNQISIVNSQITKAESAISQTQGQIAATEQKITQLDEAIDQRGSEISQKKAELGSLIASWYMEGDSSSLLKAVLSADNVARIVDTETYYDSIKQQIATTIERIQQIKTDLSNQKNEQDRQLLVLQGLKQSQENQQEDLENQNWIKRRLLNDTKAMISELKQDETDAQAKIRELQVKIEAIIAAGSNRTGQINSANDSSWYYSQLDSRWSEAKLGRSYATIGQYGCLITSLAMVATYYGNTVNPAQAVSSSSFSRSGYLLSTPIVNDGGSKKINWTTVDSELASGYPVLVGIDLNVDMGNSYGVSHFVVLKPYSKNGDRYSMHDPLGAGRGYNLSQVKAMRIISK